MRISTHSNQSNQPHHLYQGAGQQTHTPGISSNKKMQVNSFQSNQTTGKGNQVQNNPSSTKWHQNVEDIMKRSNINQRAHEYGSVDLGQQNPSTFSQDNLQYAIQGIDYPDDSKAHLANYNNQRLQTIQHGKGVVLQESIGRSKSKEPKTITSILNTITQGTSYPHQNNRKSGTGSKSRGNSSQARQQNNQKLGVPKSVIDHMSKSQTEQFENINGQLSTITQQNKQQLIQHVLGQLTKNSQKQKRTTSSNKSGKAGNSASNSQNLPKQSGIQNLPPNLKKGSTSAKQKNSNNQQLKGIMAAALASVKDSNNSNQRVQNNIQKEKKQKLYNEKHQQFSSMEDKKIREMNYMEMDQKYMTELISNQKVSPDQLVSSTKQAANFVRGQLIHSDEDQNTRRILSDLGTVQINNHAKHKKIPDNQNESPEYINTDNEYDDTSDQQKARTAKNIKKQSTLKLNSVNQDDNMIETDQYDHFQHFDNVIKTNMNTAGRATQVKAERSHSQNTRKSITNQPSMNLQQKQSLPTNSTALNTLQHPQNTGKAVSASGVDLQKHSSKLSNQKNTGKFLRTNQVLVNQNTTHQSQSVTIPIDRQNSSVAELEVATIIDKLNEQKNMLRNFETHSMQVTQRIDIFEEEIIKRVREIQKYSKALNTLVRKNVMVDLKKLEEKFAAQVSFIDTNHVSKQPTDRETAAETLSKNVSSQILDDFKQQMQKIEMNFDQNNQEQSKFQESIQNHLQNKFQLIQSQLEQFEGQIRTLGNSARNQVSYQDEHPLSNKNLDLKLSEHTQLLGLMEEQLNEQDGNIQQLMQQMFTQESADDQFKQLQQYVDKQVSEIEKQIKKPAHSPSPERKKNNQPNFTNDEMQEQLDDLQKQFEGIQQSIEGNQSQYNDFQKQINEKLMAIDQVLQKNIEEGEGRDGLILQQNQDISNLFQAHQQILENEKKFSDQIESIESQTQQFAPFDQVQEIVNQLQVQIDDQVKGAAESAIEQQIPEIQEVTQQMIENLRQNQEGRLQLCIDSLKDEIQNSINNIKMNESSNHIIDDLQKQQENTILKVQGIQSHLQKFDDFQTSIQSLELRLQAQFDEQSNQVDQQIKMLEANLNENIQSIVANNEKDKFETSKNELKGNKIDDEDQVRQSDLELIHNIISQHQESLKLMQSELNQISEQNQQLQSQKNPLDQSTSSKKDGNKIDSAEILNLKLEVEKNHIDLVSRIDAINNLQSDNKNDGLNQDFVVNIIQEHLQQFEIGTQQKLQQHVSQNEQKISLVEKKQQDFEAILAKQQELSQTQLFETKKELKLEIDQNVQKIDNFIRDMTVQFDLTKQDMTLILDKNMQNMSLKIEDKEKEISMKLNNTQKQIDSKIDQNIKEISCKIEDISNMQSKEMGPFAIMESKIHGRPSGLQSDRFNQFEDMDLNEEDQFSDKLNTLFTKNIQNNMQSPDEKMLDQIFQNTDRENQNQNESQAQQQMKPLKNQIIDNINEKIGSLSDNESQKDELEEEDHEIQKGFGIQEEINEQDEMEDEDDENYDEDFEYDGNDDQILGLPEDQSTSQQLNQQVSINSIRLEDQNQSPSDHQNSIGEKDIITNEIFNNFTDEQIEIILREVIHRDKIIGNL